MKRFLNVILFSILISSAYGQSQIASPQIVNYNSFDYKAGIQNWGIAQGKNGVLYFGNNEGLLSYDGSFWKKYQLPNLTIIRSLKIDLKGRIYVGGQDEIGYFFPNQNGTLQYHSLNNLVPLNDRKFADIWNVELINDEVFFRSVSTILHFKDGIVKIFKAKTQWQFMGKTSNLLFAQEIGRGLMVYDSGNWKPICEDKILKSEIIASIIDLGHDSLLVSTQKKGLFILKNGILTQKKTSVDETFFNDRIYCAIKVNENWLAFGTASAGVLIVNKDGKLIQSYSSREGLQKNYIRSAFIDKNKNLWLGLDDGIDMIAINSAIKHIDPDRNKQITSYAVQLFDNQLFIGASNGLFASPIDRTEKDLSLSKGEFKEIKNAKGQVWNLEEINNHLLIGHEDGFFVLNGDKADQIYYHPGTWLFQPVSNIFPSTDIIAGTYEGLRHIQYDNNKFVDLGKIPSLDESLRFMVFDPFVNAIWASHPYHGVFKIELDRDSRKVLRTTVYSSRHGLPSNLYNYVFYVKNRIVVAASNGIYEFDKSSNRFVPSSILNPALKGLSIQYLKEDKDGNVWFVTNKNVGVVDFHKPVGKRPFSIIYIPELKGKVVGGFEKIYPIDNENIFIGATKGVFHVNYKKYSESITKPGVLLDEVRLLGKVDSVIFGGYFLKDKGVSERQDLKSVINLPHTSNSLHFEYSSTLFEQRGNMEFAYQLEGFDKDWAVWSDKSEKEYTNLPPGSYTFKVKARNNLGNESEIASYKFTIEAAWYQNSWSYMLYIAAFSGLIYLIFIWQKKQHRKDQANLGYLHQLELDRTEKEIVRLKNEKLESEVNFKNKELSTMTMHLVQRGQVLAKIKEVISSIIKKHDISDSSTSFRQLLRLIREVDKSDEDWDQFTIHFTNVNADFFDILKAKYPDVTSNELKLCAYLKMNLSSKEIAQLMNITIKAVEVGRYRLRKKLHLQSDINLYDFLLQLSKGEPVK
ncbi:MAG: transcriptional regulator [Sphingobacteriales bacterium]|nr:transcriptional regulator [Sphingobacteriales bacterium]